MQSELTCPHGPPRPGRRSWSCPLRHLATAAVALLALPALLPVLTAGAESNGALSGQVADRSGAAVVDAVVRIPVGLDPVPETTTTSAGDFTLEGLEAGRYMLQVSDPTDTHATAGVPVLVEAGASVEVDVVLQPVTEGVVRVAGAHRVATAIEASRQGWDRADTVVIASAGSFPDALTAAPLAVQQGGPLLLVGSRVGSEVLGEIGRLGASRAVVIGGIGAVPYTVEAELQAAGLEVERIPGEARFDTAAQVARAVGAPGGMAVVASGLDFADALAVAPLAAAEGLPILLATPSTLPDDTRRAIQNLNISSTLVVGGRSAISNEVSGVLPSPERISGADRYATSAELVNWWVERGGATDVLMVATGHDYPDALTAGPVGALTGSPLFLLDGGNPAGADAAWEGLAGVGGETRGAQVFGGGAVVTDAVLERLREMVAGGSP